MSTLHCRSAGKARHCATCAYNPMNQRAGQPGRPITPTPRANGGCPQYREAIPRR